MSKFVVSLAMVLLIVQALIAQGPDPVPFASQPLVPTTVSPGASSFSLTVNGAGFVPGSTVLWNGKPRVTTFVSGTQVTAAILAGDVSKRSTAQVQVRNPHEGRLSNPVPFPIGPTGQQNVTLTNSIAGGVTGPLAVGYFDGDHNVDLAVLVCPGSCSTQSVAVLLGNGDGTFRTPVFYSVGTVALDWQGRILVADFNQDGRLDVAVANSGDATVSVLLGNGDGTFRMAVSSAAGFEPVSLAAGDFDRDGNLDIIFADPISNAATILLGNGDGTFLSGRSYPGNFGNAAVTVADLNLDGNLDFALAGGNDVNIWVGHGDGTFGVEQSISIFGPTAILSDVVSADFNHDGYPDLAVADTSPAAGGGYLALGNGDGSFQPLAYQSGIPFAAALGDFNNDDNLDMVYGSQVMGRIFVEINAGRGVFHRRTLTNRALPTNGYVAVADFNNDGKLDVAFANGTNVGALLQTVK